MALREKVILLIHFCIIACIILSGMGPIIPATSSQERMSIFDISLINDRSTTEDLQKLISIDERLNNEIIDQNQSENNGLAFSFTDDCEYVAQGFRTDIEIVTSISLLLRIKGSLSRDVRFCVSLRRFLHIPDEIYEIDCTQISENEGWIKCEIPFKTMDLNQIYYIVCNVSGIDGEDGSLEWFYGGNDPYINGEPYKIDENDEWDPFHPMNEIVDFCFRTYGYSNERPQPPNLPDGPTQGYYGKEYQYITRAEDKDNNQLMYQWSWGDGEISEWLGPFEINEICTASHVWQLKGSYLIKVKAKDSWGFESDWSDLLTTRMEKRKMSSLLSFYYYLCSPYQQFMIHFNE